MPRAYRRGYGLGGLLRRRPKRRFGRRVYRKKIQNKVHSFVRYADKDTLYPSSVGPNSIVETLSDLNLAYTFKLDNVINPSDFTNLYDQYRINKVVLMLEPVQNQTSDASSIHIQNKKIRVIHDYNDANPLLNEDQYLEYSNCKSYNAVRSKTIAITLYPKIANIVENAGGSANAFTLMSSNKVWLNIAEDEVPHFGIKIFVPNTISSAAGVELFKVRAKFWLSMKNTK